MKRVATFFMEGASETACRELLDEVYDGVFSQMDDMSVDYRLSFLYEASSHRFHVHLSTTEKGEVVWRMLTEGTA